MVPASLVTDRPGKWTYLPLSLRDRKENIMEVNLCCNNPTGAEKVGFSVVGESGADP